MSKLKEWRKANGVTLKNLSDSTGIPITTLHYLERRDTPILLQNILTIEKVTWGHVMLEDFVIERLDSHDEENKGSKKKNKKNRTDDN